MKIFHLSAYILFIILKNKVESSNSAVKAPLDVISLDDITPGEREYLSYLNEKDRDKRSGSGSGSGDILNTLKNAIGQSIKKKIGQIAKSSASASGHFSKSSSSSDHGYHYDSEPHDHKSFNFWQLKKSILNTLLQAIKAIKGGVIAIKGQIIKVGGHLLSAKGKLVSSKGEAITKLGKNIASSAILVPHGGHSAHGADYGHSQSYYHHSDHHGSPSAPGLEYELPDSHQGGDVGQSGILVLKKIPYDGHDQTHYPTAHDEEIPKFSPIKTSGPSISTIFGKFFRASSSLDPHEPVGFGDVYPESSEIHQEKTKITYGTGQDTSSVVDYGPTATNNQPVRLKYTVPPVSIDSFKTVDPIKVLETKQKLNLDQLSSINSFPQSNINLNSFPKLNGVPGKDSFEMGASSNIFLPTVLNTVPTASTNTFGKHVEFGLPIKLQNNNKQPFDTDIVHSISYELGPDGPKRLT